MSLPDGMTHRAVRRSGIRMARLTVTLGEDGRPSLRGGRWGQSVRYGKMLMCIVAAAMVFTAMGDPLPCGAGGVLHMFPPTVGEDAFAVARPSLLLSRTTVTVSERSVEYRIDQSFYNNNEFPLEGVYLLPFASGNATAAAPEVRIDGVPRRCVMKAPEEFFGELRDLTRAMQDPALVGLAGKTILMVNPVRMGVRQQKSFRIQYQTPISITNDCLDLLIPLDGERYSLGPVREFEVRVRFKISRPLRTVFSPTHSISVFREAPHRCLVTSRSEDKGIRDDFRLLTTLSGQTPDARLFFNKSRGDKGTFMVFLEPPPPSPKMEEPPKDVVFAVDCSASMDAASLDLAKRIVVAGLERLRRQDRFNVLTVSTATGRMTNRLVPAGEENVAAAVRFVNGLQSSGGTDLYDGLIHAMEQFDRRNRACSVILVGDGRATVGVINPESLIEKVRRYNRAGARVFAVGLGKQAEMAMLDRIAVATRGIAFHLAGHDDTEGAISSFWARVSPPQVSNVSLELDGVVPEAVSPEPIPDLFGGESVVVLGRYDGDTDKQCRVRLRGRLTGQSKTVAKTVTFPASDESNPFLTELWGMRRMARLLERARLRGADPEIKRQIDGLGREFMFVLPTELANAHTGKRPAGRPMDFGSLLWKFKTSFVAADVVSDKVRRVRGKTFVSGENGWTDTRYRASLPVKTVEFLSDEYFALLHTEPDLGPYLALGPNLTLVRNGGCIRITATAPAHLSPSGASADPRRQ